MKLFIPLLLVLSLKVTIVRSQDSVNVRGIDNIKLLPVLWQQQSAEYAALCYQAFNLATYRLNDMKLKRRKRYAIITDVDETVLDNSYFEARQILKNEGFDPAAWKRWTSEAKATAVPGAIEFFKLAASKGVQIYYVSNRDTSEVASTIDNLKALGFPHADREHMLFMDNTSSKEPRRQHLLRNFEVVMMFGDNLNDFATVFERKSIPERNDETKKLRDEWGRKFIVLPNVIYGEWENALQDYSRKLSPSQKEILLRSKLQTMQ